MKPYFEGHGITLYHGDFREVAPLLPRVDAVITDPPYGETSLDWDVWPMGWPAIAATLAPQLWCFGSMRMFWNQRDEFAAWKLAQEIVWEKQNGSGFQKDRFKRVHELAAHFYHGKWGALQLGAPETRREPGERKTGTMRRKVKTPHLGGHAPSTYTRGETYTTRSVLKVNNCHGYAVNETQKPEGIVAPLMAYSVPAGGSVIDLFAGSGTTLAVARSQGKRAYGVEKRESQCEEIAKRLSGSLALC